MSTPAGKKILLFQSPAGSASTVEGLPGLMIHPEALLATDTPNKAESCRELLLQERLKELRGLANSLEDDAWTFDTHGPLIKPKF
mmetsp:Transcript_12549/g.19746  ORF Transcript_12549/g.19746 Transcript_12549/m.19746 type:complete len:85 (-) Transcript_12549:138-392(-)